jgi:hypothetical protein
LAGDFDDVAYLYGLLVVEGFFGPFSEAGVGRVLRRGHAWKMFLDGDVVSSWSILNGCGGDGGLYVGLFLGLTVITIVLI